MMPELGWTKMLGWHWDTGVFPFWTSLLPAISLCCHHVDDMHWFTTAKFTIIPIFGMAWKRTSGATSIEGIRILKFC
jgi:hypothetical protein